MISRSASKVTPSPNSTSTPSKYSTNTKSFKQQVLISVRQYHKDLHTPSKIYKLFHNLNFEIHNDMSSRNDTLLSLCLAQAELSPLHYRHGSVIVRGGKVIGQGFNCYRPGFDGGALKTGMLPSSSLDGPAMVELKVRLKSKSNHNNKDKDNNVLRNQQHAGSFIPFEMTGSGHDSNKPLSMHSEMMAIVSALSLSSGTLASQTSARGAKCLQKPCISLPCDSKQRKARARVLKAYTQAICDKVEITSSIQSYAGKTCVQQSGFEPGTSQPGPRQQKQQRQVEVEASKHCISQGKEWRKSEHEGEGEE